MLVLREQDEDDYDAVLDFLMARYDPAAGPVEGAKVMLEIWDALVAAGRPRDRAHLAMSRGIMHAMILSASRTDLTWTDRDEPPIPRAPGAPVGNLRRSVEQVMEDRGGSWSRDAFVHLPPKCRPAVAQILARRLRRENHYVKQAICDARSCRQGVKGDEATVRRFFDSVAQWGLTVLRLADAGALHRSTRAIGVPALAATMEPLSDKLLMVAGTASLESWAMQKSP